MMHFLALAMDFCNRCRGCGVTSFKECCLEIRAIFFYAWALKMPMFLLFAKEYLTCCERCVERTRWNTLPKTRILQKKLKIQIGFHVGSPMLKFMSGIRCHVGAGEFEHFWTLFGHFSYRHRTQQAAIEDSSKTSMLAIIVFQWRLTQRFQWIWGS
jgi:hypothetical protein